MWGRKGNSRENFTTARNWWIFIINQRLKVCVNCMPFPEFDPYEFVYNLSFLKLPRIFFKLLLKNRKQKI